MKIVIGSDHAGFQLKVAMGDLLRSLGHEVLDVGAFNENPSDYPDFAEAVGRAKLFEQRGVADCPTPEAEVLADHDPDAAQRSDERLLDELDGLERGQLGVEADDQELVRLLLGDQRRSLVERGEPQRLSLIHI